LEEQKPTIEKAIDEQKLEILNHKLLVENQDQDRIEQLLETSKQWQVNVPLIDALLYMLGHVKNLKEIIRNKKTLEELEVITLSKECSAILQKKLPQKLNDLGSFTIPCIIGSVTIKDVLADLGASINVMPYSMFKKLGMGTPRPTKMTIQQ